MKALFISGIDFESPIQIGDHHLAKQFANNGWDTAFISLVITPFHLLSKNKKATMRKFRNFLNGGYSYTYNDNFLWSYVPGGLISPKNFKYFKLNFLNSWQYFTIPKLKKILSANGFEKVDLLYIRDPYQQSILNLIDYNFLIYRIADNDEEFETSDQNYRFIENSLAQKTDLVLFTAKNLQKKISELKPKNYLYFPNGVDLNQFTKNKSEIPEVYKSINKPIIVYTGSIDFWFDFDLLNYLSKSLPEIAFVIIGPNEKYRHKFIKRENLIFLGTIPHAVIGNYLFFADIGIIPFNVKNFPDLVNSINPIKLYEYLACGLPTIATKWDELIKLGSPAILCSSYVEFKEAILSLLKEKPDKSTLTSFAAQYDWNELYNQLVAKISIFNKL